MAETELRDADGDLLVPIIDGKPELGYMALTPCCNASGKGVDYSASGVACRKCHEDVDWKYGVPLNADGSMRIAV